MSNFYSREPISLRRILAYGILAAVGVAVVGYLTHEPKLYIFAPIAGAIMGGFGFLLQWSRTNIKPIQAEPGQPARYPRWVYWMFYGSVAASAALNYGILRTSGDWHDLLNNSTL